MAIEEKDNQNQSVNPKPVEKPQPSIERQKDSSEIQKSQDPDWSNKQPLHEGYRPTIDSTDSEPPSDSGTSE